MENYRNGMVDGTSSIISSADLDYQRQMSCEPAAARRCAELHNLPAIHHYWTDKHLVPRKFQPFGITDPEHLFYLGIKKYHERFPARNMQILSIGMGDCDMESRLAERLLDSGIDAFEIECVDIHAPNAKRALDYSRSLEAADYVLTQAGNIGKWLAAKPCDIVLCNQSLHHMFELEYMLALIKGALAESGVLLVSEVIGRNGRQVWPEALGIVEEFWKQVPARYKYNHVLERLELRYSNHDYSIGTREGVRSQDLLPLLNSMFNFELFIPFAGIAPVFVDRPFGYNFNAESEWDQDFIDRVHERDEQCILSGELKPTRMLGALCKEAVETRLVDSRLTPEFCIRHTSNG
jgi:hypothetical protein